MKILVADRISPLGVEFLKKQDGFEVVEAYGSSSEELLEHSKDASAIIARVILRLLLISYHLRKIKGGWSSGCGS